MASEVSGHHIPKTRTFFFRIIVIFWFFLFFLSLLDSVMIEAEIPGETLPLPRKEKKGEEKRREDTKIGDRDISVNHTRNKFDQHTITEK